jgi:hypothetical protein
MSTKTVKLNATLHEELKSIAEKEGFVLQDLIEEKLTEVLEEKGVYSFDPSNVEYVASEQTFNMKLSPSNFQALIIMIKRLCLNEKVSNINQMNNLMEAVKTMESVYEDNKRNMNVVNDFFSTGQTTIAQVIREFKTEEDVEKENIMKIFEKSVIEKVIKTNESVSIENENENDVVTLPLNFKLPEVTENFLTSFEQKEIERKKSLNTDVVNYVNKLIIQDNKSRVFKVMLSDLHIRNTDYLLTLETYSKINSDLYYLYKRNGYAYFAGDMMAINDVFPKPVYFELFTDLTIEEALSLIE